MQDEIVAPTRDRERDELNRPEPPEDLEHSAGPSLERSGRREEMPGHEKPARGRGGDPHSGDASRWSARR
jgi:hypothetical protein